MAIVKHNTGAFTFHEGNGKGTSFFLPPYCELVTMQVRSPIHSSARPPVARSPIQHELMR